MSETDVWIKNTGHTNVRGTWTKNNTNQTYGDFDKDFELGDLESKSWSNPLYHKGDYVKIYDIPINSDEARGKVGIIEFSTITRGGKDAYYIRLPGVYYSTSDEEMCIWKLDDAFTRIYKEEYKKEVTKQLLCG